MKAALELALASGAIEVQVEGKRIRYRSVDEIKSALAHINGQLAREAGTPAARLVLAGTGKGLR